MQVNVPLAFFTRFQRLPQTSFLAPWWSGGTQPYKMMKPGGLVPFQKIAMPMLGLFGAAYVFFSAQQNFKILGGTKLHDMPSWAPEYREALQRRFLSNDREGAPDEPRLLNPFRSNMPATIRNAADLPSLESEE